MSDFHASYIGIGNMIRSDYMLAAMMERGQKVMDAAIARAPVGGKYYYDPHPGRYKASFKLEGSHRGGYGHNRAEARVSNFSPEAIYVEYGHRGAEPYHTMLIALLEGTLLWSASPRSPA